jgi:adenylate cyclase class IV
MNEFSELEYKYKADDIKLQDFQNLMESLQILKKKDVSSWDHYYINKSNKDEFIRFRVSDSPELTIKRKVNQSNNWNRVEVDLPLRDNNLKTVNTFVDLLGYEENFSIYKTCFIYWLDYINFVYYIVYDSNMNEKSRFIEVEVNKEKLGKEIILVDEQLKKGQEILSKLGLSPQNRLKKSLFEIFVK